MRLNPWSAVQLAALTAVSITASASAQERYVHPGGSDTGNNGQSWAAPWQTLRHALEELNTNGGFDEIWVAMGEGGHVYTPHADDPDVSFLISEPVVIRGGFQGPSTEFPNGEDDLGDRHPGARSVLSGDLSGSTSWSVNIMKIASLPSGDEVRLDALRFVGPGLDTEGAIEFFSRGLWVMTDNESAEGPVHLTSCDFTDCNAPTSSGGGAILSERRLVNARYCEFSANHAVAPPFSSGSGGAISIDGGVLHAAWCRFEGNFAHNNGGAVIAWQAGVSLANCTFTENSVKSIGGGSGGGGAIFHDSNGAQVTLIVSNCLFDHNIAASTGGGAIFAARGAELALCTFAANEADSSGPGGAVAGGWSTERENTAVFVVTNCVLWDNTSTVCEECPDWYSQIAPATVDTWVDFDITYSCVEASSPPSGTGNISDDPEFSDESPGEFQLLRSSPAINAGDESIRPSDAEDVNGDLDVFELHPEDLTVNVRVIGLDVDMGAYEHTCLADLNDDGVVNGADLGIVLAAWGTCPAPCLADLNGDGQANGSDLGLVLAAWGACPGGEEMMSGGGSSELEELMEQLGVESVEDLTDALLELDHEVMVVLLEIYLGA